MAHGLDFIETEPATTAAPLGAADRILSGINTIVVNLSSAALVVASFVLTYSVSSATS